jgi:hypothetical protein
MRNFVGYEEEMQCETEGKFRKTTRPIFFFGSPKKAKKKLGEYLIVIKKVKRKLGEYFMLLMHIYPSYSNVSRENLLVLNVYHSFVTRKSHLEFLSRNMIQFEIQNNEISIVYR